MYLFERVEKNENQLNTIKNSLDFLFNSFCRNKREFNGFGVNMWKIDTNEIYEFVSREEPRIYVHSVFIEQAVLTILFEIDGTIHERSYI